ncbi:MAG: WD40 repeat domain-containing protein [Chloroflexota bacterium]
MKKLALFLIALLIFVPVQAQNISNIPQQVMQLGYGTAHAIEWHPTGDVLAVGSGHGVWLYDDELNIVAHFEIVGNVRNLAWSPDGQSIATITKQSTLTVWAFSFETISLEEQWSDTDDAYRTITPIWSPDSQDIAISTSDGVLILNAATGDTETQIEDIVSGVSWHPDGTQIAGITNLGENIGRQVRTWDTQTGDAINTYMGMDNYLNWSKTQWSPDGSSLIGLTTIPATVYAWDTETGTLLNDPLLEQGEFTDYFDLVWDSDNTQLITVSRSVSTSYPFITYLERWDTETWSLVETESLQVGMRSISKHPTSDLWTFLTADGQFNSFSWDDEFEVMQSNRLHGQPPQILSWSPDSQQLGTATRWTETLQVWDITDDTQQPTTLMNPYPPFTLAELVWQDDTTLRGILRNDLFTAPGTQITSFVVDWDTQTTNYQVIDETQGYIAHDGSENYLAHRFWSDDFTRVATILEDDPITIATVGESAYSLIAPDDLITTIEVEPENYPNQLYWSPDNSMVILTFFPNGQDSQLAPRLYDIDSGESINLLANSSLSDVRWINWSPDSTMITITGTEGVTETGEMLYVTDIKQVNSSSQEVTHITTLSGTKLAWHSNSQHVAVITSSGIEIYQIDNGSLITTIPEVEVSALSWSPDGNYLAGSHADGTIRIWDMSGLSTTG